MRLAKLILHYNTPEMTAELCRMIGPDAIVIDNGSDPGKEPLLRPGQGEVIRLDRNYGFTIGWNLGVKAVWDRFDAFWLMNSDIEVANSTVRRMESVMANKPDVAMVTPSYNCWLKSCHNHRSGRLRQVMCLEFTAPVIRKSVFEKIGFFNEVFSMGYGVEFDFCLRMQDAGLKIFVDDLSSFHHKQHQTIKKDMEVNEYSRKAVHELRSGLMEIYGEDWRAVITKRLQVPLTNLAMKKIALYTTIFGDYSRLLPVPAEIELDADLFCITDNPDLKNPGGWKITHVAFPRKDLHPRMRAKFFKMFPWEVEEMKKYEAFIFIDASIEIKSPEFVKYCLRNLRSDILLYKHPVRNCIYKEADASIALVKYQDEPIREQVESYRGIYPENGGLFACGVMMTKNSEKARRVMGAWWWENVKWSYQDQLSFPVICKLLKFTPAVFAENQMKNEYFRHHWRDDAPKVTNGDKLKVDVLMPVYMTPVEYVKQAIQSLRDQTYHDISIIIVDDNNPKGELLDYLYGDLTSCNCDITVVRTHENKGISAALNIGLEYCTGDIVCRMDSDDIARPTWINSILEFYKSHPEAAICGVQIQIFNDQGSKRVSTHPFKVTRKMAQENESYWICNHPGMSFKREVIMSLGGYGDVAAKFAEDYALWVKFLISGWDIYNLQTVEMDYRSPGNDPGTFQLERPEELRQNRHSVEWLEFLQQQKNLLNG